MYPRGRHNPLLARSNELEAKRAHSPAYLPGSKDRAKAAKNDNEWIIRQNSIILYMFLICSQAKPIMPQSSAFKQHLI